MNKPNSKREVAIKHSIPLLWTIYLYASKDAVSDINDFGELLPVSTEDLYRLEVDRRYDFDEVVKYIEGYG